MSVRLAGAGSMLLAVLLCLLPTAARACFVCYGGEDSDWTPAFYSGTIVMMALPPAIILGAGFAIWRSIKRNQALLAEHEAES